MLLFDRCCFDFCVIFDFVFENADRDKFLFRICCLAGTGETPSGWVSSLFEGIRTLNSTVTRNRTASAFVGPSPPRQARSSQASHTALPRLRGPFVCSCVAGPSGPVPPGCRIHRAGPSGPVRCMVGPSGPVPARFSGHFARHQAFCLALPGCRAFGPFCRGQGFPFSLSVLRFGRTLNDPAVTALHGRQPTDGACFVAHGCQVRPAASSDKRAKVH